MEGLKNGFETFFGGAEEISVEDILKESTEEKKDVDGDDGQKDSQGIIRTKTATIKAVIPALISIQNSGQTRSEDVHKT